MSVDFDSLVLGPCMEIFARPVTYTAPGGAAVERRGVFDRQHETALDSDGAPHSADLPMLGIRLSEWSPHPVQRGRIVVPGEGEFEIFDVQPDGEGGADLILRDVA